MHASCAERWFRWTTICEVCRGEATGLPPRVLRQISARKRTRAAAASLGYRGAQAEVSMANYILGCLLPALLMPPALVAFYISYLHLGAPLTTGLAIFVPSVCLAHWVAAPTAVLAHWALEACVVASTLAVTWALVATGCGAAGAAMLGALLGLVTGGGLHVVGLAMLIRAQAR
ncbi:unnamed protein product [Pedinophyceae sp. YPF-701]|nr:unnamed protein product [Pedinophyceae sp. YPF-701]